MSLSHQEGDEWSSEGVEEVLQPQGERYRDIERSSLILDDANSVNKVNTSLGTASRIEKIEHINGNLRKPLFGIHSKWYVWFLTYLAAIVVHANRKGYSSVKGTIESENWFRNTSMNELDEEGENITTEEDLSKVDFTFLFIYALAVLFFGHIGDHFDIRLLMSGGLAMAGLMLILFGMGKYWNIHSLSYFVIVYGINGLSQGGSWPMGVATIANWFPKSESRQNLALAIWSSSASLGNIAGSMIAALIFALYPATRADLAWPVVLITLGCLCLLVATLMYVTLLSQPCPNNDNIKIKSNCHSMRGIKNKKSKRINLGGQKYSVLPSNIHSQVETIDSPDNSDFDNIRLINSEEAILDEKNAKEYLRSGHDSAVSSRSISDFGVSLIVPREDRDDVILDSYNSPHNKEDDAGVTSTKAQKGIEKEYNKDTLISTENEEKAQIEQHAGGGSASLLEVLCVPGVIDYAIAYSLLKGVNYGLFNWLPFLLQYSHHLDESTANLIAILFDIGQVIGAISAGFLLDKIHYPAILMMVMIVFSLGCFFILKIPTLSPGLFAVTLCVTGFMCGGPQNIIAATIPAHLANHESIRYKKATSTISGIIDGMGGLGAAIFVYTIGILNNCSPAKGDSSSESIECNITPVFAMCITCDVIGALALTFAFRREMREIYLRPVTNKKVPIIESKV